MAIPFNYHGSANNVDANNRHRAKVYAKFIGRPLFGLKVLDVGQTNYVARRLGIYENTLETDFNMGVFAPNKNYDVITCFEVLNHVMNPLLFMGYIRDLLKPGGTCYLSVPKLGLIAWYHCRHNFTMYRPEKLDALFEYAGLKVIRRKTYNPWPPYFTFYGFRPIFRVLLNRIEVWELRRP